MLANVSLDIKALHQCWEFFSSERIVRMARIFPLSCVSFFTHLSLLRTFQRCRELDWRDSVTETVERISPRQEVFRANNAPNQPNQDSSKHFWELFCVISSPRPSVSKSKTTGEPNSEPKTPTELALQNSS